MAAAPAPPATVVVASDSDFTLRIPTVTLTGQEVAAGSAILLGLVLLLRRR